MKEETEKFSYVKKADWETALKQCESEAKNLEISKAINEEAMNIIKFKIDNMEDEK